MNTTDTDLLPGPPTVFDELIIGICRTKQYADWAAAHDEPITDQFDPGFAGMILKDAACTLLAASGRPIPPPRVPITRTTTSDAVDAARATLLQTARRVAAIGYDDETSVETRYLLAGIMADLREAFKAMFGENW